MDANMTTAPQDPAIAPAAAELTWVPLSEFAATAATADTGAPGTVPAPAPASTPDTQGLGTEGRVVGVSEIAQNLSSTDLMALFTQANQALDQAAAAQAASDAQLTTDMAQEAQQALDAKAASQLFIDVAEHELDKKYGSADVAAPPVDKPEPKAEPKPEPKAEPKPAPKAEPKPEPKAEKAKENSTPDRSALEEKPSGSLNLVNSSMKPWADEIETASKLSGIKASILAGQVWHESRGNPNQSDGNSDGTTDVGLMCISNSRWKSDVLPELSDAEKAAVAKATGKNPASLDMHNPLHNVIGGAFELNYWLDRAGGNIERALNGYVSGNLSGNGPGDDNYASNVLRYAKLIEAGKSLPDNE